MRESRKLKQSATPETADDIRRYDRRYFLNSLSSWRETFN
jgi:hypothetical protein